MYTETMNQFKLMVVKRSVRIIFVRVTLQKFIRSANADMSNVNYVTVIALEKEPVRAWGYSLLSPCSLTRRRR